MKSNESFINELWDNRDKSPTSNDVSHIKEKIIFILSLLDEGEIRVAEKDGVSWKVNQWVKKTILLYFKYFQNKQISSFNSSAWYDKIDSKFDNWDDKKFIEFQIRSVPGSFVRKGSYIGKNCVLMPSFTNIGAFVDDGTLIDTWATIGSCAQIGKNCHISGGVGIGGVLEPLQADPVIIEDNCFIGARSEIAEGVIVKEGSVISMGVYLGQSTKIYDRETKEISFGEIPPYSVVVPGSLPSKTDGTNLYAAIIVKKVDKQTRSKTSINNLLRENV
ncbi:MAG: 2,3,4,5-tetrahydropyridine-2,6-dicarboxylate N-succinyltransferase [Rickettsiales bacterium]